MAYPAQQPSSNVVVVYPPAAPSSTVFVERSSPTMIEYDQFGQPIGGGPSASAGLSGSAGGPSATGSQIYLIAFRDHSIRAVIAYWVEGNTLHYVTPEHESKVVILDLVDKDLCRRLNRERHVVFSLP